MVYFWKRFRTRRLFLANYFLGHAVFLIVLGICLERQGPLFTSFTTPTKIFLLPIAILLGIKLPTLMHNCMHGNLKFGNFILGEITSFCILMSFGIVCNHHTLHHSYPDSPWDPHNPQGFSFWGYLFKGQFRGVGISENRFFRYHGKTRANWLLFKWVIFLHFLGNALRLWIWYLLLGELFLPLYLPGFAAYLFVFSHVNYVTHAQENGQAKILNFDSNLYYKLINFLCDGIYYHKNHHLRPNAFNPQTLKRYS